MALVEVTVVPLGTESTSLSKYISNIHMVLKEERDIKYQLTPMGTIIEGELSLIMEVILKMHEVPFKNGAKRVTTSIKIDDRRDRQASMEQKIESVTEKLNL